MTDYRRWLEDMLSELTALDIIHGSTAYQEGYIDGLLEAKSQLEKPGAER